MKEHYLKIKDDYLDNLLSGIKKAEVRVNDKDYQAGDTIRFYRWEVGDVYFRITHIHSGLGMEGHYVVLSVERILEQIK